MWRGPLHAPERTNSCKLPLDYFDLGLSTRILSIEPKNLFRHHARSSTEPLPTSANSASRWHDHRAPSCFPLLSSTYHGVYGYSIFLEPGAHETLIIPSSRSSTTHFPRLPRPQHSATPDCAGSWPELRLHGPKSLQFSTLYMPRLCSNVELLCATCCKRGNQSQN